MEDSKRHTSNTAVLLTGDFNMDVSQGPAAGAITRAQFQDAFANHHEPTTPGSFLEHGRIIDWIFTRGRVRSIEPLVHRSVSASDHYPLSIMWLLSSAIPPSVRSPCLGITPHFFWTMAPNLGADRVRGVYGTDVRLKKGKSGDEGHNGA